MGTWRTRVTRTFFSFYFPLCSYYFFSQSSSLTTNPACPSHSKIQQLQSSHLLSPNHTQNTTGSPWIPKLLKENLIGPAQIRSTPLIQSALQRWPLHKLHKHSNMKDGHCQLSSSPKQYHSTSSSKKLENWFLNHWSRSLK